MFWFSSETLTFLRICFSLFFTCHCRHLNMDLLLETWVMLSCYPDGSPLEDNGYSSPESVKRDQARIIMEEYVCTTLFDLQIVMHIRFLWDIRSTYCVSNSSELFQLGKELCDHAAALYLN